MQERSRTIKDARIQSNQITLYLELLANKGNKLPEYIAKHIKDDIWELRPGHNRIMYFLMKNGVIILLNMFRKKTQKTPTREIEKAIKRKNDYLFRMGEIK